MSEYIIELNPKDFLVIRNIRDLCCEILMDGDKNNDTLNITYDLYFCKKYKNYIDYTKINLYMYNVLQKNIINLHYVDEIPKLSNLNIKINNYFSVSLEFTNKILFTKFKLIY